MVSTQLKHTIVNLDHFPKVRFETTTSWQFFVPSLGWLSDPFKWLSDLQLGDEKVTLSHLASKYASPISSILGSSFWTVIRPEAQGLEPVGSESPSAPLSQMLNAWPTGMSMVLSNWVITPT